MKKSCVFYLLVTSTVSAFFLLTSSIVNAAPITELTLTSGSATIAGNGPNPLIPAAFASMSVDGSYDGSAPIVPGDGSATSIVTFEFGFFGPAGVYTAETDGLNGPFPGVTGDLTGSDLTLDLSSWTWWWKYPADVANLGAANVTATVDADGNFTAAWDAIVVGGPFNGTASSWIINGHVSAVPIPSSLWLFGSGLVWMAGLNRRRNQQVSNASRRNSA